MDTQRAYAKSLTSTDILKIQNEILTLFISTNDINLLLNKIVDTLGEKLNVEKVFAFSHMSEKSKYRIIHEWSDNSAEIISKKMEYIPDAFYIHENLRDGITVECKDTNELINGYLKSFLKFHNINNFGAVPLLLDKRYLGFIVFCNTKDAVLFDQYISLLHSVSGLAKKAISNAMTQKMLKASKEKYKNLFENMSDSFTNCELIYDDNNNPIDYKFLEINESFSKMFNVDTSDWIGRPVKEFMPDVENNIFLDAKKVILTGKPIENETYSIPLNKYFHYSVFKSGEKSFAVISYDITERKINAQKLEESEKKYKNLFQSMAAGFAHHEMIYDESGNPVDFKFLETNEKFTEIMGLYEMVWSQNTVLSIIPTFDRKWIKEYGEVIKTGESIEFELFIPHVNRHIHFIAYKTSGNKFATILADITNQKNLELQLASEKELLKVTLESIGDGVITTDINGKITMMNKATETMTGVKKEKAINKDVSDVLILSGISKVKSEVDPIREVLSSESSMLSRNYFKLTNQSRNKEYYILGTAAPIKDSDSNLFGSVFIFRDVTKDQKRNDEIKYLSMHDSLTGLYNRSFFEKKLREIDLKKMYPFSVIMGDANGLKITNDVFGHAEGDRLLIKISQVLLNCTSPEDIVARWGGDEFVILLPNANQDIAHTVCERITEACAKIEEANNDDFSAIPSISLGHSTKTEYSESTSRIVKTAEDLMYKKKLLESKSTHSNIIDSMKRALFEKSHETEAHAGRLSKYCVLLGKELNISHQALYDLELFSMLHDIGKVAVDESLLTKKEKLTDSEWDEIKRHPEIGYRIASSAPELSQVSEYILTHHEKWDGTGYPQGLSGNDIPIESRILAIIDAFDAMTHDRPYRKAMPLEDAVNEIISSSGTQFDPKIVDAFIKTVLPDYVL